MENDNKKNSNLQAELTEEIRIVEKINRHPLKVQFLNFNHRTDNIICPVCGNDAAPFNLNAAPSEIICENCGRRLSNLDFIAKKKLCRTLDKVTTAERKAIIILAAKLLGISHNLKAKHSETSATELTTKNKDDTADLLGDNATNFFGNKFLPFIEENQKFSNRKTGFSNLDAELNSFQPGIYIVGGLPALGKTTFSLQLLTQLANQGETCIFCSYEMSAGYLYSKILAREIFLIESEGFNEEIQHFNKTVKYPLPASKIALGNFKYHEESYKQALQNFSDKTLPLFIWELADINLDKLLNRIGKVCVNLDKPPVVCIDYLQLLTGNSDNTKAELDGVLRRLFNFRRKTNTTFIVVSSLNRANYQTEINFESFCGSGGIEYSADVIFGLQLLLDKRTSADAEKAKKEIPRQIQLKCLKNRFGANFDVGFFYYPNADIFVPMFEYGKIEGE